MPALRHMMWFSLLFCTFVATINCESLCGKTSTANDITQSQGLAHRVAIVTGGDSGLGYTLAESVAKAGATVVIAGHNLEKAKNAARNITSAGGGVAVGMGLDLGSFESVRAFVAEFRRQFTTLNYLFNNAGISGSGDQSYKTPDGFEDVFEVDYLGHFLLTELLLPMLRQNRGFSPSRVINTASTGHMMACSGAALPSDCLKDWKYLPPPIFKPVTFNGTKVNASTYGFAKFAQIQHAAELAAREGGNNIEAFSVCPGLVVTGMTNSSHQPTPFDQWCKRLPTFGWNQDPCPYTAQEGAAVLATSAFSAKVSGAWYTRYTGCSDSKPVLMQGFTTKMRSELYERSLQWVGEVSKTIVV